MEELFINTIDAGHILNIMISIWEEILIKMDLRICVCECVRKREREKYKFGKLLIFTCLGIVDFASKLNN